MTSHEADAVHRFGGDWTTHKLDVLTGYLGSYMKALKNQRFEKVYIDAFAGTGYRQASSTKGASPTASLPVPDLADPEPQGLLEGSARRALSIDPEFDHYIFIERSSERCTKLDELKKEFPGLGSRIEVRLGDGNAEIRDLCDLDWSSRRAVLFLDPYGMQVEWSTIEAVSSTRAIDTWILFPLGIGVNRLLARSGDLPRGWRRRLDLLLGTEDWYEEFYKVERTPTLFEDESRVVKASLETIGRYFNERLLEIFPGVAEPPGVLRNSRNSPLYLLCFAAANERGSSIALRIAGHLLEGLH